jgi:predicted outer membrane repeat protein
MSRGKRAGWLSHRSTAHRRSAKRPRADCPTLRRLRVETLEERLALAVLTVNSLDDGLVNLNDTVVTLRDALYAADWDEQVSIGGPSGSGADEIRFLPGLSGTITLTLGQLFVRSDLTITGPDAALLSITGDDGSHVFEVSDNTSSSKIVAISGLNIAGGATVRGINNLENLTVENCTIRGHTALFGGGIYNHAPGTLIVRGSTISGSTAAGNGGGIYSVGILTVENSSVSGNSAGGHGGGIINHPNGTVTVLNSTISANTAGLGGGGIRNDGLLTVQNSAISGNAANQKGGGIYNTGTLTVHNSTISGNSARDNGGGIYAAGAVTLSQTTVSGNLGAGISAKGAVTLSQCTVSENLGGQGFGITSAGDVTITQSTVSGNSEKGISAIGTVTVTQSIVSGNRSITGGGIFARGNVTITQSTISDNSAREAGGGIYTLGTLTVQNSTISGNSVAGNFGEAYGGGIFARGDVAITQSTVSGNSVTSLLRLVPGGGIFARGDVTITRSTVSGNRATGEGGGIFLEDGAVALIQSTVTDNHASRGGGGVFQADSSFNLPISIRGSIVAGNRADEGGADFVKGDFSSALTVNYSLVGEFVGQILIAGIGIIRGVPHLAPLANNGGPTRTHALMPGSPAIDAGDPSIVFGPNQFDARGAPFVRVVGARIDIGAFELQTSAASADFDDDADADGADFLAWQRGLGATGAAATQANGNADGDGDVDGADLGFWKAQFGGPPPALAAAQAADQPAARLAATRNHPLPETGTDWADVDLRWRGYAGRPRSAHRNDAGEFAALRPDDSLLAWMTSLDGSARQWRHAPRSDAALVDVEHADVGASLDALDEVFRFLGAAGAKVALL